MFISLFNVAFYCQTHVASWRGIYANQTKLDPNGLKEQARTAALDVERFDACLASGRFKPQIESDLQSGAGITGTPAFYINGVPLTGAQPLSEFEKIIDSQLTDLESPVVDRPALMSSSVSLR